MNESSFDGLTRQLGRRRALQALGAAVMATAGGGSLAGAKKGKNTQQKNRKKKQQQRIDEQALGLCAGQVAACDAFIAEDCDGDAGCLAQGQLCCDLLATCAFTEFIACINAPVNNPDL